MEKYKMIDLRRLFVVAILVVGVMGITCGPLVAQEGRAALFAVLSGGNSVSNDGDANAGDRHGHGSATVIVLGIDSLCYAVLVNLIDTPFAMHIHEAFAGSNGPVVIPLTAPDSGNPGAISGCITDIDPALIRDLRIRPARFYVNVHNNTFPGGAMRGQLH